MKNLSPLILVFVLIALTGVSTVVFGQTGGKLSEDPIDSQFKILSSDDGFADGSTHSTRFLVLFVYVRPGYRTRENIYSCAQKIKRGYSKEEMIIAVFTDRSSIDKERIFSDEYEPSMRAVLSIYAFSTSTTKETFRFFPRGMSQPDFKTLGSDEERLTR